MEGRDHLRSPEFSQMSFSSIFFFHLSRPFRAISRRGFIWRPRQITQCGAAELVFHWTQETAADCDRLQRGGIVLIEINIVLFPPLVFLTSALKYQTNMTRPSSPSRCQDKSHGSPSGWEVLSGGGGVTVGYLSQEKHQKTSIISNLQRHC